MMTEMDITPSATPSGIEVADPAPPVPRQGTGTDEAHRRQANLAAALHIANAGLPVFPVRLSQANDGEWRKSPAISGWQQAADTNEAVINDWWRQFPDAAPGIALGRCGLVVVDPDRHRHGADGVSAFAELVGRNNGLPVHPVTRTAGGGEHHYFRQRTDEPLGNRPGDLPAGICVRGAGGFVVAPGAIRPDGAAWLSDESAPELASALTRRDIPVMPAWLHNLIRHEATAAIKGEATVGAAGDRERKYAATALAGCARELEQAVPGSRNTILNAVAYRLGRFVARGWLGEEMLHVDLFRSASVCGLVADDGDASVRATIASGLTAGRAHPHPDLSDTVADAKSAPPPPNKLDIIWDGDREPDPPDWLVRDLVPLGGVGFIVGESRAGKSFLAVSLAAAIGRGKPFFTKRTRPGGTLYVAAEAARTIPGRLKAARIGPIAPFLDEEGRYKEGGKEPPKLPVAVVPGGIDLLTESGVNEFIRMAHDVSKEMVKRSGVPLRLIVIDTTLAQFPIGNWNDPAAVTLATNAMARIASETGAAVLGVHHHGKDVSRGPAGSYALTAAADFIVSVLIDGDVEGNVASRRVALTKQREGSTGWGCEFSLRPFKIGTDEYGEDVVCAFVEPEEGTAGSGKSRRGRERRASGSLSAFMKALATALDAHGRDQTSADGTAKRAVDVQDVRDAFAEKYQPNCAPARQDEARRKAFSRGLDEALQAGAVTEVRDGDGHWLMLTERH